MYKQLTSMQRPQTLTLLLRKPQEKRVCTLLASANLHYVVRCGARVASWVNMPDSRHTIKAMEWRKRSTHNAIAKRSLRMVLTKNTTKYPGKAVLDPQAQKICNLGFKSFNAIAATSYEHYSCVFNFFVSRATNTFA